MPCFALHSGLHSSGTHCSRNPILVQCRDSKEPSGFTDLSDLFPRASTLGFGFSEPAAKSLRTSQWRARRAREVGSSTRLSGDTENTNNGRGALRTGPSRQASSPANKLASGHANTPLAQGAIRAAPLLGCEKRRAYPRVRLRLSALPARSVGSSSRSLGTRSSAPFQWHRSRFFRSSLARAPSRLVSVPVDEHPQYRQAYDNKDNQHRFHCRLSGSEALPPEAANHTPLPLRPADVSVAAYPDAPPSLSRAARSRRREGRKLTSP